MLSNTTTTTTSFITFEMDFSLDLEEELLQSGVIGFDVMSVGKRQGRFKHWEPIFIGTHQEPYYEERLSWDGKADKMSQGYILCVKDYDFMVLSNAFLIHKPGIKHVTSDKRRNKIVALQNKFIAWILSFELKTLFGDKKGCVL